MREKDKQAVADILMSMTLVEAALAMMQETIDREREILRADVDADA